MVFAWKFGTKHFHFRKTLKNLIWLKDDNGFYFYGRCLFNFSTHRFSFVCVGFCTFPHTQPGEGKVLETVTKIVVASKPMYLIELFGHIKHAWSVRYRPNEDSYDHPENFTRPLYLGRDEDSIKLWSKWRQPFRLDRSQNKMDFLHEKIPTKNLICAKVWLTDTRPLVSKVSDWIKWSYYMYVQRFKYRLNKLKW